MREAFGSAGPEGFDLVLHLGSILGQSIFVTPIDVRRTAYAALAQAARGGAISLDTTSARLDEAGAARRRLAGGAPEKQIVVP